MKLYNDCILLCPINVRLIGCRRVKQCQDANAVHIRFSRHADAARWGRLITWDNSFLTRMTCFAKRICIVFFLAMCAAADGNFTFSIRIAGRGVKSVKTRFGEPIHHAGKHLIIDFAAFHRQAHAATPGFFFTF